MCGRLSPQLQSKQAASPSVKCNKPRHPNMNIQLAEISLCSLPPTARLPPFYLFLSLPRTPPHRRRLNPLLLKSLTERWTALCYRGVRLFPEI